MPVKPPICPCCPKCGSRDFQSVRPEGFIAFQNDRQCTACATRYSPPTPLWAALVFILIGIALFAACAASVVISLARGSIAGLPLNCGFAVVGILSVRQGLRSLREEVVIGPEPVRPTPNGQTFKQWLRKSRGKLLCVPVAAVVLMGGVEWVRRYQSAVAARHAQERAGVRALKELGGDVMGMVDDRPNAISLERSEKNRLFEGQNTGTREIVDDDVKIIASFSDLERLYIKAPEITDAGLRQLLPQPKLTVFTVNCPRVTEEGLRLIVGMDNLEFLNLSGTSLRSLSDFDLGRKMRLTRLDLSGTKVDSQSLSELALLPALKELDLSATNVDDECLTIVAKLSNLEQLHLSETQITDQGILALQPLSTLRLLDVSNTHVSEAGRAALKRKLPSCTTFLE